MVPDAGMEVWAEIEARRLLRGAGTRWSHVEGVARAARAMAVVLLPPERRLLVALAYVHDIGYSSELVLTGAHQLDGAFFLREHGLDRLAGLVAHHSEARFELKLRGMEDELGQYAWEKSFLADALTYCDLTTGPTGSRVTPAARLAEVEMRYGKGLVVDALRLARPHLVTAVQRVERRLSEHQAITGLG